MTAHDPREQPKFMFKVSDLFLPYIKECIRKSVCCASKKSRLTHQKRKKKKGGRGGASLFSRKRLIYSNKKKNLTKNNKKIYIQCQSLQMLRHSELRCSHNHTLNLPL